jgi:ferrochelatase
MEDVLPFLEKVTRGRAVPRERLLEVAEHYYHFGGKSPINDQNRALIGALRELLDREGPQIPIYWGNRNWHPILADTLRQMRDEGVRNAAAFITSAFGSFSGCRQYMQDIALARAELGEGAPGVEPLALFHDHPDFIAVTVEHVREALARFPAPPHVAFTAHSVPLAAVTGSPYVEQLIAACEHVAEDLNHADWKLVFQSRSGPPSQPWLEPDILDHIRGLHAAGRRELVISPIGFVSDHMEVIYDLDTEAAALCEQLGVTMVRARTPGTHPLFVRMIRDLLTNRRSCPHDCCPPPHQASVRSGSASGRPEDSGRRL